MTTRLKAGFARTDVTPAMGTPLLGYPVEGRKAESVRDGLNANALVLERDGLEAVVLGLDICILDEVEVEAIRQGVRDRTGISGDHVTVCAIQSHSGPSTLNLWGWGVKDMPYIELLLDRTFEAVEAAHKAKQPATMGIGTTQSDVGVNRREVRENHEVALGVNPWGPYDPDMTVLRFEGKDGPIATMIHYGAHPTVFSRNNRAVSRDWPGVMVDRVEALTGAPTFYINGAVGDVAPRMSVLHAVGDGETALMEVGTRAAMDAIRAYRSVKNFQDASLSVIAEDTNLPYRPLPPLEEAKREFALAEPTKDQAWQGHVRIQALGGRHSGTRNHSPRRRKIQAGHHRPGTCGNCADAR